MPGLHVPAGPQDTVGGGVTQGTARPGTVRQMACTLESALVLLFVTRLVAYLLQWPSAGVDMDLLL